MMLVQHYSGLPEPPHLLSHEQTQRIATSPETTPAPARASPPRAKYTLRDATLNDAQDVALLGGSTFSATFGFSMPSADLEAYLEEAYTLEAIQKDILDPSKYVIVAISNSGHLMGFAQLTEGTTEPCLEGIEGLVELQRLYVNRESHGMGVGKALTKRIEDRARSLGHKKMWLGVWEGNFVAQKVYEAMGFERVGDHEFKMGRCIQTDWIMCKDL